MARKKAEQVGGGVLPGTTQQITEAQLNARQPKPLFSGGGYNPPPESAAWDVPQTTTTLVEPTPEPTPTPTGDPYAEYLEGVIARQRQSAFDNLYNTLKGFGIDTDGTGLAAVIRGLVDQDRSADFIMGEIRKSTAYAQRFPGMAALVKRGQAMSEAEYISQERSYRNVLQSWNLPTGYYDDPTDYGTLISNGLSVRELDDRVRSAKTFLDSTDPQYRAALNDLGISDGALLAHVLDGDRAQNVIAREMKQAAFGGAANKYGFGLDAAGYAKYGDTLGSQYDTIGADQIGALEQNLSGLQTQALNQGKLAQIDTETGFRTTDILDANILNDQAKLLKSQQRAQREQARFSGTSAITAGTLSRNRSA